MFAKLKYIPIAPKPEQIGDTVVISDDLYACTICNMTFFGEDNYERHNERRHPKKKHPCPHCDKAFVFPHKLKMHVNKLHSTILKHPTCPVCRLVFSSRSNLYKHEQSVHSSANSFFCRECCSKFNTFKKLEDHQHTHKPQITHACSMCSKKFKNKGFLLKHIKKKHEEHQCSECGKVYKHKVNLTKHFDKHCTKFEVLATRIINEDGVVEVKAIKLVNEEDVVLVVSN